MKTNFDKSLRINKQILKKDHGGKFENACASLLMAGSIGISTIEMLNAIQELELMPISNDQEKHNQVVQGTSLIKFVK